MRIALTGADGMLGTDLVTHARQKGHEVVPYIYPDFDLMRSEDIPACVENADVVINCAAYTNVEKARTDEDTAMRVNGTAVGELVHAAGHAGIPLVHISTDFVFDGKKPDPYLETDPVNPLNVYGKSKLLGEELIKQNCSNCAVIRVQWTYGKTGHSFVQKVLSRAAQPGPLKVVADQIGSPTWTRDVSQALVYIAENFQPGLYHYCSDGAVSRYDLARFILEQKGIVAEIIPCLSSDFPSAAPRPLNSRFNCDKIKKTFGLEIRPWQDALAQFLE